MTQPYLVAVAFARPNKGVLMPENKTYTYQLSQELRNVATIGQWLLIEARPNELALVQVIDVIETSVMIARDPSFNPNNYKPLRVSWKRYIDITTKDRLN